MTIGITEGKLSPCPDSPNCVSSQSPDVSHFIEPLTYQDSRNDAFSRLLKIIKSLPRSRVISSTGNYIHAEMTSRLFGFVDDIEFFFNEENNLIQVRSASRVGYSDLGVNRKRVETIRKLFNP